MGAVMSLWNSLVTVVKEAYYEVCPKFLCQVVEKNTDNLMGQATFLIKSKRFSIPRRLKTKEIIQSDELFSELSKKDRKEIGKQYFFELNQPSAYIEEFPIIANENREFIFKILLLDKKKIVCGSATYFVKENTEILKKLSEKDIVKLAMAYRDERFSSLEVDDVFSNKIKNNISFLTNIPQLQPKARNI